MATGRVAFKRDSVAETMTAILREEPLPVRDLAPASPAAAPLDHRALPRQGARGTLRLDAGPRPRAAPLKDHASEIGSPVRRHRRDHRPRSCADRGRGWAAAVAVACHHLRRGHRPRAEVARAEPLPTFKRLTFQRGHVTGARFAPDGQTVIYSAAWEGRPSEIFSTHVSRPESRSLGISPAQIVAVADSGEIALILIDWVSNDATFLSGTLALMPISGGAPRKIRESVSSADLSSDGKVLTAVVSSRSTMKDRDTLEFPLGTRIASGIFVNPRIAPDGRELAVKTLSARRPAIAIFGRDGKERVLSDSWRSISAPVWAGNGKEVWFSASQDREARTLYGVSRSGREGARSFRSQRF